MTEVETYMELVYSYGDYACMEKMGEGRGLGAEAEKVCRGQII